MPVGDGDAFKSGAIAEFFEAPGCFLGTGASQVRVFVGVDEGKEVLAASESLFGFDFGAEPRVGRAGVAFKHLDVQVPVLDRAGDGAPLGGGR